jgi:hypothetical protein
MKNNCAKIQYRSSCQDPRACDDAIEIIAIAHFPGVLILGIEYVSSSKATLIGEACVCVEEKYNNH